MRLSAAIDLDAERATALAAIDAACLATLGMHPLSSVYAEKVRLAEEIRAGGAGEPLAEEARLRGISRNDLAEAILERQGDERARVMARETERQRLKARIAAAGDQHAILAIVAEATSVTTTSGT